MFDQEARHKNNESDSRYSSPTTQLTLKLKSYEESSQKKKTTNPEFNLEESSILQINENEELIVFLKEKEDRVRKIKSLFRRY